MQFLKTVCSETERPGPAEIYKSDQILVRVNGLKSGVEISAFWSEWWRSGVIRGFSEARYELPLKGCLLLPPSTSGKSLYFTTDISNQLGEFHLGSLEVIC